MTQLDINPQPGIHKSHAVSKADRFALLKMLDEKPSVLIASALQNAKTRGFSADPLLISTQSPPTLWHARKPLMLAAIVLLLGLAAYVGQRHYQDSLTEPGSVMGVMPGDRAKTDPRERGGKKEEVVVSRLSENVRNVIKSHVPDADVNITPAYCSALAKQLVAAKIAAKAANRKLGNQRPTEPAPQWVKRMTSLKNQGRTTELEAEALKFLDAYPGDLLPKTLRVAACID
jgi:hypothetical protein